MRPIRAAAIQAEQAAYDAQQTLAKANQLIEHLVELVHKLETDGIEFEVELAGKALPLSVKIKLGD